MQVLVDARTGRPVMGRQIFTTDAKSAAAAASMENGEMPDEKGVECPLLAQNPARVLIVDDELPLLRVYRHWLKSAGYIVESAADGHAAAGLLREMRFDVVVTDIAMQGMDGMKLLHAVRERDLDLPVILITGTPAVDTAIKAVELGALRYLVKPFDEQLLLAAVASAVRLHQVARLKRQALALVGGGKQLGDLAGLSVSFDRALASLWMAYQPIVAWPQRTVFAVEALLRCAEPTLPHPGAIIEAAQRLGRLHELGRAVRDRVASVVEAAPCELVFVNLHTQDLLDETLYARESPLTQVALRVVLEITERATLDEVKDASCRMAELRKIGFRIAVDDLGAGYAGLASFAQIEPEIVKFDVSLVRGLDQSPTKTSLIRSMTTLFKQMGVQVIAEGVETVAERDALEQTGCDLLQGFLFARPGPPFPAVHWDRDDPPPRT
ncbi:MAG: EAL domain-containing protein [Burkholderiales bacterium]|nr:EAL domain-containing protein [Burkholderiales bacterium]